MIPRYTLPEMAQIWSEENKFSIWLEIEISAAEALNKMGIIPDRALENIRTKARFNINRINEIEAEVHHDVIAFLTNVSEHVGDDARFIHYGMTSSDVLDTCLAIQMKQAGELLVETVDELIAALREQAKQNKHVVMMGRSHGIHAEPITLGLKMAVWYDEMNRNRLRLLDAIDTISVGQISGAVGTFDHLDPQVQEHVCRKLNLKSARISTQVLQRDRHAAFMNTLALIGCSLEKIAVEIRHLQRTEVQELAEFFASGQKGSSAMPHKKNPIISERISGMSRILRGHAIAAMENVALWHERDISHSSVERIILPDSTLILYYMLKKTADLIARVQIYPDKMKENLMASYGLFYSQTVLLSLTQKGVSREKAYKMVQRSALKAWEEKEPFQDILKKDDEVREQFSDEEFAQMFDLNNRLRQVDYIFSKVGIE